MPFVAPDLTVTASLDEELSRSVDARLRQLEDQQVLGRIWARDHTVWGKEPTEIADRLGWLTLPHSSRSLVPDLRAFAGEVVAAGFSHAVLLGMGGSSLAPEVFRQTLGVVEGMLDLRVLDTTHPDAVVALEREVPLDRTLFVVSSKSGTTVETRSHLAYFHELVGEGSRFVAVTDPGTPLEALALDLGFRRVFSAPPDVGGRYSALTVFGLVPAALMGADLEELLVSAAEASAASGGGVAAGGNPAAVVGSVAGEAARSGRDKLTLAMPSPVASLGAWIEQLVAESTGKQGTGIVPVDGEPPGRSGRDRLGLLLHGAGGGEPWVRLPAGRPEELGAAVFTLELATAVAGHVLGINPFDQPDVQSAKDRTSEALRTGHVDTLQLGVLDELLGSVRPGDYVAIQAFVAPGETMWRNLQSARTRVGERLGVATTLGYGPRYLHSTGQLHKGGPGTAVFVQVVEEHAEDRPIPGERFTFGQLMAAQAAGDLAALRERGRRAARVPLEDLLAWGA
jgi:transaldolase / glucose-6-phosphate isomerase